MNDKLAWGIALAVILLIVAFFVKTFTTEQIPDVSWVKNYKYENKDPHGCFLIREVLKKAYSPDKVITLDKKNYIPHHQEDKRKGYFTINDYFYLSDNEVSELTDFVSKGNDAIIITRSINEKIDSIFSAFFELAVIRDSTFKLKITGDSSIYNLVHFDRQFDKGVDTYNSYFEMKVDKGDYNIERLSFLSDTLAIHLKVPYGSGNFYFHSMPDAFTNVAIKYAEMGDYILKTLPLLRLDTLFLDHYSYKPYNWSNSENAGNNGGNSSKKKNPLQFVMAEPSLKWAYYLTLFGLILFVLSRGRRRQRVIPVLAKNENTSLEYVQTLSELYKSQNQHDKLAKHLKIVFVQWVKNKYFLNPDQSDYISKLAHKSKFPEHDVSKLINRLDAAQNNNRFDEIQLSNLYQDLNHFYKNCQ